MTKDTQRLDHVWYLLGLDFVRPYLRGMWFPFKDEEPLMHIRAGLLIDDLPTFHDDPDERIYRRLLSARSGLGADNLGKFLLWQKDVLVVDGQDRVAENWWYGTLFRLVNRAMDGLYPDLERALRSTVAELRKRDAEFKSSITTSKGQLSSRDEALLQRQASTSISNQVETISGAIANTLTANALVEAWRESAANLSLDRLTQLRDIAQQSAEEYGGTPGPNVPLPGLWDFGFGPWMVAPPNRNNAS